MWSEDRLIQGSLATSAHDGYKLVGLGDIHFGIVGFRAISALGYYFTTKDDCVSFEFG